MFDRTWGRSTSVSSFTFLTRFSLLSSILYAGLHLGLRDSSVPDNATPSHESRDPNQPIANFRCISVAPEEARFSDIETHFISTDNGNLHLRELKDVKDAWEGFEIIYPSVIIVWVVEYYSDNNIGLFTYNHTQVLGTVRNQSRLKLCRLKASLALSLGMSVHIHQRLGNTGIRGSYHCYYAVIGGIESKIERIEDSCLLENKCEIFKWSDILTSYYLPVGKYLHLYTAGALPTKYSIVQYTGPFVVLQIYTVQQSSDKM
ncbi:hypothetical protein WN51_08487 [Melipona quadrifasciata]|uniref:Uncharacterized protein n=1 Tax=Melipona quadrifasciata TaxID=166423 RepID=A0A0N0U744_9HYME|nr:hypothetical protein WN51_08487 [Melipona quadrifasciata]